MADERDDIIARLTAELKAALHNADINYNRWAMLQEEAGNAVVRANNAEAALTAATARAEELAARVRELEATINSPIIDDFLEGVTNEAAHQIERWGASHDAGKEPQDWFWLLGWLAGKAVKAASSGDLVKAKHHTISSAASLLNWHRALSRDHNEMRPGVDAAARGYESPSPPSEAKDDGRDG